MLVLHRYFASCKALLIKGSGIIHCCTSFLAIHTTMEETLQTLQATWQAFSSNIDIYLYLAVAILAHLYRSYCSRLRIRRELAGNTPKVVFFLYLLTVPRIYPNGRKGGSRRKNFDG